MPLLYSHSLSENRFIAHSLVEFGGNFIYSRTDVAKDPEYEDICSKHLDKTVRKFFMKMLTILTSFALLLIWPTHKYVSEGIRTTTTEVRIPFIEEDSDYEFMINIILMSVVGFHGMLGYIVVEVAIELFGDINTIAPKLIKYKLKKLDDAVESKRYNELQISLTIVDICKQAEDSDK